MTPAQFVTLFVNEKRALVRSYVTLRGTPVASEIKAMQLSPQQLKALRMILDGVLTDAFYTVLLALDGAASLGGKQATYSVRDANGNELTGGDIEAEAWERFHGGD